MRTFRIAAAAVAIALAACGAPSAPATPAGPAPLDWLVGRWESADGIEHWVPAGDSLIGVGLRKDGFEVMIIEERAGRLVFTALPDGLASVDFPLVLREKDRVRFENLTHDFPQVIEYARRSTGLAAKVSAGSRALDYAWSLAPPGRAEALEAADLAFAADVAERRVDAWVDAFEPEGAMWHEGRIEGPADIRELMAPAFANPEFFVAWAPIASGMGSSGDLGYTVGEWRRPTGTGAYVTIWRRQADGRWKVAFDTGNAKDAPPVVSSGSGKGVAP